MSVFDDILSGNWGNVGPRCRAVIFSDFGTDLSSTLSNPIADIDIAAGVVLPFIAPEIGAVLGG